MDFDHYISRNIKAFYTRRLFSPTIYILLLIALWVIFPLHNMVSPTKIGANQALDQLYEESDLYTSIKAKDLFFTGYTEQAFGQTKGYYYYTIRNNKCDIFLLSPSTCEQGLPYIEEISFIGKLRADTQGYNSLIERLANDLDWTSKGLSSQLEKSYMSEPDYHLGFTIFFFVFYFGSLLYAGLSIILYLLFIRFPFLSPACQNLIVFGHPRKMLEEAEEELATLPQLATEDMFITEHYFILTSPYGNAIVPIQEILWIYKYSTLHKILWYHFSISYTLNICANKHLYIHCPKNIKSDIDGIIDYLSEANHDILVGFNEENRLQVQAIQGKPLHIEKWKAFLHKKV